MPQTYEGEGFQCLYPDNWTLSQEKHADYEGFTLESPGTAMFSVLQYRQPVEPQLAIDHAVKTLEDIYEDCEVEPVDSDLPVDEAVSTELHFFVQRMLVAIRLQAFRAGGKTYLCQQQAEDREYDRTEAVFNAMLHSLLQSLQAGDSLGNPGD